MSELSECLAELIVYGLHKFRVEPDGNGIDDDVAWIRLSRYGWTPCEAGEGEGLRSYMVSVIEEEGGKLSDAMPSGFGFLASKGGAIIGVVTECGLLRRLTYAGDGSSCAGQARMSIFSLTADEAFEGREVIREPWDYWAMGRPLGV